MDLVHAFPEQEQPTADQNQISPRERLTQGEQRRRQSHDPGDRQQQQDPGPHRQPQAESACGVALRLGQATDQDRDEDDVVDAQNDFKRGERRQRYPRVRIGDPIEHESLPFKARTRIADLACDATVLR